ncbi:MAG: trp operon repressor [Treponema sp.]|nr:trp operon repressor [Treponema sp.]
MENTGISEELVQDTIKELCSLLVESGDEQFIYDFLICLLTPPELKSIASRWLLVKDVEAGVTQREIAKKYGMSLCKITRGSKELHKPDSAFRKMLEILKNK